jgi:large subunit ribosomal protein L15e
MMSMGAYKYIRETLKKQYKERNEQFRSKIISWRKQQALVQVERPSNLARARTLGYKAKQGYILVRIRVDKGRRTRQRPMGGRKHKNYHVFEQPGMSHQAIAEQRVNRKYRNMEVLNSYWIGEDGNYKYFEVILADPAKATVNVSSVMRQGKTFRGLTSSGGTRSPSRKKRLNKKLRRKLIADKVHPTSVRKKFKPKAAKTEAPKAEKPAKPVRKKGTKSVKKTAKKKAVKKKAPEKKE